jgi:hypothetical protein
MSDRERSCVGAVIASLLSLCGCGQPAAPLNVKGDEPSVIEEITVQGFDPEGEPVSRNRPMGRSRFISKRCRHFLPKTTELKSTSRPSRRGCKTRWGFPCLARIEKCS